MSSIYYSVRVGRDIFVALGDIPAGVIHLLRINVIGKSQWAGRIKRLFVKELFVLMPYTKFVHEEVRIPRKVVNILMSVWETGHKSKFVRMAKNYIRKNRDVKEFFKEGGNPWA